MTRLIDIYPLEVIHEAIKRSYGKRVPGYIVTHAYANHVSTHSYDETTDDVKDILDDIHAAYKIKHFLDGQI
jgi:hypothetical protein